MRDSAGVLESDGVARTEARLETILPQGSDRERLRSRLRPLLGLEAEEASREENFAAWREFLEGLASTDPTVLVVEDLHWADEPMAAFMDYLAQSEAAVPLLVLASARPEVTELSGSGAGFVAAATHLALGPLSGEETGRLVVARLGAKSLPAKLQASSSRPPAATRSSPRSSCACCRTVTCWSPAAARHSSERAPRCRCPTPSGR